MTTVYTPTAEEIAQHYSATMDSVNLINELMDLDSLDEEQVATVDRNVRHLELMVEKDYWNEEDLQPFENAIIRGKTLN
jgi:hypothetical protein